jgi:hypothetical protein
VLPGEQENGLTEAGNHIISGFTGTHFPPVNWATQAGPGGIMPFFMLSHNLFALLLFRTST